MGSKQFLPRSTAILVKVKLIRSHITFCSHWFHWQACLTGTAIAQAWLCFPSALIGSVVNIAIPTCQSLSTHEHHVSKKISLFTTILQSAVGKYVLLVFFAENLYAHIAIYLIILPNLCYVNTVISLETNFSTMLLSLVLMFVQYTYVEGIICFNSV